MSRLLESDEEKKWSDSDGEGDVAGSLLRLATLNAEMGQTCTNSADEGSSDEETPARLLRLTALNAGMQQLLDAD